MMLHANLVGLIFIKPELLPMDFFYIAGIGILNLLLPCDIDLDPMTFVYELHPYSVKIHRMCKYELPTLKVSKVIV